MYLSFYQLHANPFGVLPPEHPLFLTDAHKEALATLVYGLIEKKPFVVIIGEVGTGKTTVLKAALARVDGEPIRVVEVSHPLIPPDRITQILGAAVGIEDADSLTVADIDRVNAAFLDRHGGFSHTALVIDEAQLLPRETLEFVRLVSNMKAAQAGLLQFLFVGQPEFWILLETEQFRHLRQRISLRCVIPALSATDAKRYIEYRLQLAGAAVSPTMNAGAVKELIRAGRGIPRRINNIADNALLLGFGSGKRPLTAAIVRSAVEALEGPEGPAKVSRRTMSLIAGVGIGAGVVISALALFILMRPDALISKPNPAPAVVASTPSAPPPVAPAPPPTKPVVSVASSVPAGAVAVPPASRESGQGAQTSAPSRILEAAPATSPAPAAPATGSAALAAVTEMIPGDETPPPVIPPRPVAAPIPRVSAPAASVSRAAPPDVPPTPATAAPSAEAPDLYLPPAHVPPESTVYRVKAGDTVDSIIARFYNRLDKNSLTSFLRANPSIKNLNRILQGTYVVVPRPVGGVAGKQGK